MPSTYAHYRMGQEVRSLLSGTEKDIVELYPELFRIGLHGPDILFYYKPLFPNKINQIGYGTHARPGKEFFERAGEQIKIHDHHAAYLSYLYGFICHFALDETCHGYIDQKIAESGVSHTEIEVEFDRMLMLEDGLDPLRHRLTDHIIPSMKNAEVIQAFFEGTDTRQMYKALHSMIIYNNLLTTPSKIKRGLICALLRLTGNYREMHGLMVNYQPNPRCEDSTKKLWLLYQKAEKLALSLIGEYSSYLKGEKELNPIYRYTFGSQLTEEKEVSNAV